MVSTTAYLQFAVFPYNAANTLFMQMNATKKYCSVKINKLLQSSHTGFFFSTQTPVFELNSRFLSQRN